MKLKQWVDRFADRAVVGVDLGSAALKVVEITRREGRIALRRCGVAQQEGKSAAETLKKLLGESGIAATQAAVGLASPEVIVKPFRCPAMPDKELKSAIELEAESAVLNGHSMAEMSLDWQVLPSSSKESTRGILAVVPKTVLAASLQVVKAAGLHPIVVDVEGLSLWNAYWVLLGSKRPASQTVLLVNVGFNRTNLVIGKGPDDLVLVRDFQQGAKALAAGRQNDWLAEVEDSLRYARSNAGLRNLEAIHVTGGGSSPGLARLLQAELSAPVSLWNPLEQIDCHPGFSLEKSAGPLLTLAIGLALRRPS